MVVEHGGLQAMGGRVNSISSTPNVSGVMFDRMLSSGNNRLSDIILYWQLETDRLYDRILFSYHGRSIKHWLT